MYEWDETKRLSNIEKHAVDFIDAPLFFENAVVLGVSAVATEEVRFIAVGRLQGRYITTVFVERQGKTRIISMRKARKNERERYRYLYSRRAQDAEE